MIVYGVWADYPLADPALVPEFEVDTCSVGWVCGGAVVGGYLVADENGYDRPRFRPYVAVAWEDGSPVSFVCADCYEEVEGLVREVTAHGLREPVLRGRGAG